MSQVLRACVRNCFICLTLCDPMGSCPPGSSEHGILQAGTLEWVAISSSRGSSQPRDRPCISCTGRWVLSAEPLGKPKYMSTCYRTVGRSHRVLSGVNCPPHWFLNSGPYSFIYACLLHKHIADFIQAGVGSGWEACLDTRFKTPSSLPLFLSFASRVTAVCRNRTEHVGLVRRKSLESTVL